jgi:hypothetical protein
MPVPLRSPRYRRCPQCQMVRLASEFGRVPAGPAAAPGALWRLSCPACGLVGRLLGSQQYLREKSR